MDSQNLEQAQNIELTPEELEEIQGAGPLVPSNVFPIGTFPYDLQLRLPGSYIPNIPNPDVLQYIGRVGIPRIPGIG